MGIRPSPSTPRPTAPRSTSSRRRGVPHRPGARRARATSAARHPRRRREERRRRHPSRLRLPLRERRLRRACARRRHHLHRPARRGDRRWAPRPSAGALMIAPACPSSPAVRRLAPAEEARGSPPRRSAIPVMLKAAAGGGGKGMRARPQRRRARRRLRARQLRGRARLRRRRRLPREVHRAPPPRRDPGARRPARQGRLPSASASAPSSAATRR